MGPPLVRLTFMRSRLLPRAGISCLLNAALCGLFTVSAQTAGRAHLLSQPGPTFSVPDSALSKELKIIVYGDIRFTDPSETKAANPQARRALVAKIAEEHPDALVITGDLPYRGKIAADYAEYRAETGAWRSENLRIYPVLGDHEFRGRGHGDPLAGWWSAFPELKDRRWYSVALGSRVYLLGLDSGSALTAGSPQRLWLESQMSHLPKSVDFLFVALHHPPVADLQTRDHHNHNPQPNEIALRDFLSEVAPHTHAQIMVAAGHIHNYERFLEDNVTWLVSGGGGAHPYEVQRTAADRYQATDFPNFHYVIFRLHGRQMEATMERLQMPIGDHPEWQARDSFTIDEKAGGTGE
jgi:hypothetical protein